MSEKVKEIALEEDEIDLIAIAKTIWEGRKTIIKSVIVFTILGFFVAIFSPKEYVAKGIFVPQVTDAKSSGGGLSGLAAMAGISLGSGGQSAEISPAIYPQVIAGTSFCKELMQTKIKVSDVSEEVTFFDYFTEVKSPSILENIKKYTIGLPGLIKSAILPKKVSNLGNDIETGVEILSEDEYKIKQLIGDILSLEVDDKVGTVSISAKMPEAYAAAQVAKRAQNLLQKYVTDYKISNAQKDLNFVEERFADKEKEFYLAQEELAKYADQNKNITSAYIKAQYDRLSADYQLKFNIYNELAKQLEQAKIKVTEDTPTFNIIQKVTIPNKKSAPNRILILIGFIFLGFVAGTGYHFVKYLVDDIKERWNFIEDMQ
nr:Wzz/FepE/Etk N-terminal domain-containing protein [uncultured Carboxylicivirga sp.]